MEPKIQVLLIDDDIKFCRLITEYLAEFNIEVHAAHDGPKGIEMALEKRWQAVILDVMLPFIDGFKVLRRLRDETAVPILMLTGLGDEADRIVGLELGADDYLPKTSSARELLARLRAVLRRSTGAVESAVSAASQASLVAAGVATPGLAVTTNLTTNATPNPTQNSTQNPTTPSAANPASQPIPNSPNNAPPSLLNLGPLCINLDGYYATLDNEQVPLTPVEFDLLVVLARARGRVKTREDLINEIRDRNYEVFDRSIDVHISALRKKLNDDARRPRFIRTVRNVGYMALHNIQS